jgi:hypothetical protein
VGPSLPFFLAGTTNSLYRPPLPTERIHDLLVSDASDFQKFSYSLLDPSFNCTFGMDTSETELSSGHRELKAVLDTFTSNSNHFYSPEPAIVYWFTDSSNLVGWLQRGSRKRSVQKDLVILITLLNKLNIAVVPVHVPREYAILKMADLGSKYRDTDDWSIDSKSFAYLQTFAGSQVTCDVFAYNTNARVCKFYSKIQSPGCSGINAFAMDWSKDFNWVCPPVKEIVHVIRHIFKQDCSGILVVPNWPTSLFWSKITTDGKHLFPSFIKHIHFKPYLFKGSDCDSIFDGISIFNMIGIVFDSKVTKYVAPQLDYCVAQTCISCGKC